MRIGFTVSPVISGSLVTDGFDWKKTHSTDEILLTLLERRMGKFVSDVSG
jgi:hypothetical protein